MKTAREILRQHEAENNGDITAWKEFWILRAMEEYREEAINSIFSEIAENKPLYKDSGLWQQRSDDMNEVIIQQEVNETNIGFL